MTGYTQRLRSSQLAQLPEGEDLDLAGLEPLSPLEALAGKRILILGATGFLAKIVLALLLERYSVGRIYVAIRGTSSRTPEDRLWNEVLSSEAIQPLREAFGPTFDSYVRELVEPISGDLGQENLGLDEATHERLKGQVDLVINSAGLVNFNPPLDNAVESNALGAARVGRFTKSLGTAKLVHVSTCFVAGEKNGRIQEDPDVVGYFPRAEELQGAKFDWRRELSDLQRIVEEVKGRTDDGALEVQFAEKAKDRLKSEGREVNDRSLRAGITAQRRRWVADEQIRLGIERARYWGWPNIYTLTKAIGEQSIASIDGLDWAIVRPAIVESSVSYPFPGWNEGMNTTAPLAYLGMNGQVLFPGEKDLILDVVPVDYVTSTIVAAAAALLQGESRKVYQVAAGDVNPCSIARVVTLVGLYKRRNAKKEEAEGEISKFEAFVKRRTEPIPVKRSTYHRLSAPAWSKGVGRLRRVLDNMEPERYGPFGGMVSQARKIAKDAEVQLDKVDAAFQLFMPFIWENRYVFRTRETRRLFARMNPADRSLLSFDTVNLDWRHYWLDIHLPGLEKWVFPRLDDTRPAKMQIPRDYRDLAEMFHGRVKEHGRRVAFRMLSDDKVADIYSYRDAYRAAQAMADFLARHGVGRGDRVMLASEGRPEWGMSYFGIILAGATAVPIDVDLSRDEQLNIAEAAGPKLAIASEKLHRKLLGLDLVAEERAKSRSFPAPIFGFEEAFERAHDTAMPDAPPKRRPDDIASIIYTSGTTGRPKGVVLTDRNFTALTSRMTALFDLNRTDAMLSVLPPHHTFEFSAGLLMPLSAGASITYLSDRTSELIGRAFDETPVTAMVGVPAVWEALHRKIFNEIEAQGPVVEYVIRALMRLNNLLRDQSRINFGRWLFRPMQNALGGRMRYLVSGAAALKPQVLKDLRGLGFSMYEGYGLTEASPVVSVGWPRNNTPPGSVGWPLPGLEVRVVDPNPQGVGEIIARGPTIMRGYLDQPEATEKTLKDGWLHTGDQGRLDDKGRLYIVGRDKDVIIDSSGKNVYPDEIEELYGNHPSIKELSVVGVPAQGGTGESVAALVVPDYDYDKDLSRSQVREEIRQHFREMAAKLPFVRRVKILHLWETDLPRTSTKKVKRPEVREQIIRLESTLEAARRPSKSKDTSSRSRTEQWVRRTAGSISQKDLIAVDLKSSLTDGLGFDSLMQLELFTALETEFPKAKVTQQEMNSVVTLYDVVQLALRDKSKEVSRVEQVGNVEEDKPIHVPDPIAALGRAFFGKLTRLSYDNLFDVGVQGRGNIPANTNYIVAANHASHLDMGLAKYALGDFGRELRGLAARDYFFDDDYRRAYFEHFTYLLPMDRHGSPKRSLRLASDALRSGESLLIFPEGTRSRDGQMQEFKTAVGYLALHNRVDILPIYLGGTHEALPVGANVPKRRELWARIGNPLRHEILNEETVAMSRSKAYKHVAQRVEAAILEMSKLPPVTLTENKRPSRHKTRDRENES